ncbi:O-antigen ligase family protein, partial [Candidatus Gottesmanbacteria bacterium]|nr:O-antigen ligase family protein [Candidatus Gottesmanbacteria bacterium]
LYTKNKIKLNIVIKLFIISAGIIAFIGWIEYFLYPDLRNLYYLGWDPHYKRIFSSFLDPNFLGLFMVLGLLTILLSKIRRYQKFILGSLFFFTLMFTYSRGSYLAFIITLIFYFIKTHKTRYILVIILLIAITAILLPRPSGEGVRLGRLFSITEGLENWKFGWKIFADHPILGVGFNTIRYVKISYQYPQDNLLESHSGAGLDNSILLVAATSGIIGLIVFLLLLFKIYSHVSILTKVSLLAIVVHSLFVNSYFYPWVMVWLWIMIGVTMKK